MSQAPTLFLLDALGGLARLVKRSPTLDGSVPLRVVGACLPFLDGNAYGLQVGLQTPLSFQRQRGRYQLKIHPEDHAQLARAHTAALPRLVAQGFLPRGGYWHQRLQDNFYWSEGGLFAGPPALCLWTGLLLKPAPGLWLRVSAGANRTSDAYAAEEHFIHDSERYTPLVLTLRGGGDTLSLGEEIATLGQLAPGPAWAERPLEEVPALGRAHVSFYDAHYFAEKRGKPTRRYRQRAQEQPAPAATLSAAPTVVEAGPCRLRRDTLTRALGPDGPQTHPVGISSVSILNQLPFTLRYDGMRVAIDYEPRALFAQSSALEARWRALYGEDFVSQHRGALWYLTKYFTPHPAGEPHFFVKPWAFFQTPPGVSSLIEGTRHEGFSTLRGVVATDWFHAAPAVFAVHERGRTLRVDEGTTLARVLAVPRGALREVITRESFLDTRAAP